MLFHNLPFYILTKELYDVIVADSNRNISLESKLKSSASLEVNENGTTS